MFTEDFYPTPEGLIIKMLEPYKRDDVYYKYEKLSDLSILEPSAGKGDILNFISQNLRYSKNTDFCVIENNPDLQAILRDKDYTLIASDFLTYNDDRYFDLILMNPPFSNGDEHLLHAIEIAKNTDIVCILNAETIKNPYSKNRKLLLNKINDLGGTYEYLENEFSQAERKTNVEIVLIRLTVKDESERFDFDFKDTENVKVDFDFDIVNNDIARQDLIGNLNIRYNEVRNVYLEYLKAEAKYNHFKNLFLSGENFYLEGGFDKDKGTPQSRYNHLSDQMKVHMWNKVINELGVEKYMSHKVKSNFNAFVKQQSKMAFTKDNVADFFQLIMNNRKNIWDDAVVDVFDMLTSYYHENRNHIEGWRTNDKFMVNRKLILPNWCNWGSPYDTDEYRKKYGAEFKIDYRDKSKYSDIDKVLAYLKGTTLPYQYTILNNLENHFENLGKIYPGEKFDNTCESAFFKIKFFKKGTLHLEFKDENLWRLFNLTACAGKNWLPDNEKSAWEEEKRKRRQDRKEEERHEEESSILMIESCQDETIEYQNIISIEEPEIIDKMVDKILTKENGQIQLF